MDLISVIVPIYNSKRYLNRCIDSIVDQTYKNLEIILVDDGSTDGSSKICDDWKESDERVKVIHQQNQGISASRNHGISFSTGSLILFVDIDYYHFLINEYVNQSYEIFNSIRPLNFIVG